MKKNFFTNGVDDLIRVDDLRSIDRKKTPDVRKVCILYSVSVILLVILGSRVQRNDFYSGVLISEFVLILLPPLILLFIGKYDVRETLRLNKPRVLSLLLITLIMVFAIPAVNSLNQLYLLLLKCLFGSIRTASVPSASTTPGLIINILVIAGSAGICEEVLFRGVIMRGLERFGDGKAIFLSALLFGLWHMYFTSFLGTFLLGLLIGYIVYRTNSLYSGIYAHFVNNAAAVSAAYAANYIFKKSDLAELEGMTSNIDEYFTQLLQGPASELAFTIISIVFTTTFFGSILAGLLVAFRYLTRNTVKRQEKQNILPAKGGLKWLAPGLAFIGFIYFAEGITLLNMHFKWVNSLLDIMGLR